MNILSIIGNLGADPEMRYSQSGNAWCTFNVAVRRRFKKDDGPDTDWFRVKAFGKTAEIIGEHFHKGSQIGVVGSMQNDPWEDDNGNKRDGWTLVVDQFSFVGKKDDGGGSARRDRDDEDERPRQRSGGGDRQGRDDGGKQRASGSSSGGTKSRQASRDREEIPF